MRFSRPHVQCRPHGLRVLLVGALVLYVISLCVSVTFYGRHVSAAFRDGVLGFYWGNDPAVRNCRLHNNFMPPWNAHGAGADLPAGTVWDVSGPDLWPWLVGLWWANLDTELLPRRVLGLWLPEIGCRHAVLPFWLPVATMVVLAGWRRFRHRTLASNGCTKCGYDLTGNTSGVCPECGGALGNG